MAWWTLYAVKASTAGDPHPSINPTLLSLCRRACGPASVGARSQMVHKLRRTSQFENDPLLLPLQV
ncbi:hypothetical protein HaLaN_13741 [Haematococcus lacustris]|uniref:Uncharacterized protein n=1 Tax=Haematococcus lacustris TaxID=44745 RepID=A0A699Z6P3_HAELA|nr:hypothetical protein HaLaN_13741 [Haematococcus lacustris]